MDSLQLTFFGVWVKFFVTVSNYNVTIWESTKPWLYSKLVLFKMQWKMLRVLPQFNFLSLYLSLKNLLWGTTWAFEERGFKNMTSQSWKRNFYQVDLDVSTLTYKSLYPYSHIPKVTLVNEVYRNKIAYFNYLWEFSTDKSKSYKILI